MDVAEWVCVHSPRWHLKPRLAFSVETAYLPISVVVDKVIVKKPTTVTGLLGFPKGYEGFFSNPDVTSLRMMIFLLERSDAIAPEDVAAIKEELMRKHWRPDYLEGKPGAEPPKWN